MRTQALLAPIMVMMAMIVASSPTTAFAQPQCDASISSEWLRPPSDFRVDATIRGSLVLPVVRDVAAATAMLEKRAIVLLTPDGFVRFAGTVPMPQGIDERLRPYLVRAVFPTLNPRLDVRWSGRDLHVFATGLGCSPFMNHPIIVFLDREPVGVFVMASAAL